MPANNIKYVKVWKTAHKWLEDVSDAYKRQGITSASMTALASQAILAIPKPNGDIPSLIEDPQLERE